MLDACAGNRKDKSKRARKGLSCFGALGCVKTSTLGRDVAKFDQWWQMPSRSWPRLANVCQDLAEGGVGPIFGRGVGPNPSQTFVQNPPMLVESGNNSGRAWPSLFGVGQYRPNIGHSPSWPLVGQHQPMLGKFEPNSGDSKPSLADSGPPLERFRPSLAQNRPTCSAEVLGRTPPILAKVDPESRNLE